MRPSPNSPGERRLLEPTRLPPAELVEGAEVGLFFRHRACPKLGRVLAVRRRTVTLALWGRGDTTSFDLAQISFFRLVGRHSWNERHLVAERQRRGGCGLLQPRRETP